MNYYERYVSTDFAWARVAPEKAVFRPALPTLHMPGSSGTNMTKLSYAEQLRHPFWQRKRLCVLERAGWSCELCGATDKTLNVHHKRYVKGALAWEYEDAELASYCEDCHASEHEAREVLDELLSKSTTLETTSIVTALAAGYLAGTYAIDADLANRAKRLHPHAYQTGAFAAASGLASRRAMADLIRYSYGHFEGASLSMDPATEAIVRELESEPSGKGTD